MKHFSLKQKYSREQFIYAVNLLLLFLVYFTTARLGLKINAVSGFATLVWPPTGIALAAIFLSGRKYWPAIFAGAFLVNVVTGAPFFVAIGIAAGNTLEAVIGAMLLNRFGYIGNQNKLNDALTFILHGVVFSTIIAATIGVTSLFIGGLVSTAAYPATWMAWWVGDALGALVVGNLIIVFAKRFSLKKIKIGRTPEVMAFIVLFVVSNIAVFTHVWGSTIIAPSSPILVYALFPLLIWAAVRFGPLGTAVTIFFVSIFSIWTTFTGTGPFTLGSLSQNLLMLQGYIGIIAGTTMLLSSMIAERFTIEKQLLDEKNKDEAILESIGDGVIVIDTKGVVMLINHAASSMLGIGLDESIGQLYEKVVKIETMDGALLSGETRPYSQALRSMKVITGNYYFLRWNKKKFPVTLTTAPIVLEGTVVGVIDVFRDISHAQEVDKAKSEFISLASHQLRTPLTTMKWYTGALLDKDVGELSEEQRQYIGEIYHNNERMIGLVNSLLNVSRIELGTFIINPVPVHMNKIADEVIHDLLPYTDSKKIKIIGRYDKHLPEIKMDPELLRIIFQNLLSNSIKYSKEDSSIHVSVVVRDREVVISVSDSGYGIPKREQEKIFTKLFRADNARSIDAEGSGLGLYIIKSIIEQSGGRIWFESQINEGSTFYVAFPLSGMSAREARHSLVNNS